MAIVQISQITNRKGLQDDLPQLAGAELGWAVDSRRLFIGNGTLAEGAPVIGNTEILTEFSDITVLSNYTYADIAVGYAAQTGPTPSTPIVRTVQAKLDDFADIRDFGAVGNGTTDDTDAINRALYQLYCRENNTEIRRSLFFPAGTYLVSETIMIPTFAKLYGEGANSSVILLATGSASSYVAQYADSRQQTGVNIGNNGATPPQNIEISSMGFQTVDANDVFLVEDATQCSFTNVNFIGPLTQTDIISNLGGDDIAGVRFASTTSLVCSQIIFDTCGFFNLTYGVNTDQQIASVTVSNSSFNTLYQGIVLGSGSPVNGGATGFRAVQNGFDLVYGEGIYYGGVSMNVSAYNTFYNVAQSLTNNPTGSVVLFEDDNNVSISDMFSRSDDDALVYPRVSITGGIVTTTSQLQLGRYARINGRTFDLDNDVVDQTIFQVNAENTAAFKMDYTIVREVIVRHGSMTIVSAGSTSLAYTDDYSENDDSGVTLSASQTTSTITVKYTTTDTGLTGTLTYSISQLA